MVLITITVDSLKSEKKLEHRLITKLNKERMFGTVHDSGTGW